MEQDLEELICENDLKFIEQLKIDKALCEIYQYVLENVYQEDVQEDVIRREMLIKEYYVN